MSQDKPDDLDPLDPGAEDMEESPELAEFGALLETLDRGARLQLNRYSEVDSKPKWAYLGTYERDTFSLDYVARRFGGGDFRVWVPLPVGHPSGKKVTVRRFSIDPAVRPEPTPPPAGTPAPTGHGTLDAAMLQLVDLQTKMLTNLATVMRPAGESATDKLLTTLVVPVVLKMLDRPAEKGQSLKDVLDMFDRALELVRENQGQGGGGGGDAIERLGLAFAKLLDKMQPAPAPAVPAATPALRLVRAAPVRPAESDTAPPPAPAPEPEAAPAIAAGWTAPVWYPYLAPILPVVLRGEGGDPATYADLIADQIPEEADALVEALMNDPSYPDNVLAGLPPTTAPSHAWLAAVLLVVRERFTEPEGGAVNG